MAMFRLEPEVENIMIQNKVSLTRLARLHCSGFQALSNTQAPQLQSAVPYSRLQGAAGAGGQASLQQILLECLDQPSGMPHAACHLSWAIMMHDMRINVCNGCSPQMICSRLTMPRTRHCRQLQHLLLCIAVAPAVVLTEYSLPPGRERASSTVTSFIPASTSSLAADTPAKPAPTMIILGAAVLLTAAASLLLAPGDE